MVDYLMSQQDSDEERSSGEPGKEAVRVILVSGFLGSGKTTALQAIGETLTDYGYTVGMITNDQASGLVDTSILEATGGAVIEIPGGCFCCNFTDLVTAANTIRRKGVDVLLAEPVGSCTDLVATVVNPLEEIYAEEFSVAPLTTLLDPERVRAYLTDDGIDLPEEVEYIFRLQAEEADVLALNKTDTLTDDEVTHLVNGLRDQFSDRPVLPISASEQQNIETWVSALVDEIPTDDAITIDSLESSVDRTLSEIDYDTYAAGEAKLGWVNTTVSLDGPVDAGDFQRRLMTRVHQLIRDVSIEVAHLKFSLSTEGGVAHANLTSTWSEPSYGGTDLGSVSDAQLLFNTRAVGDPEEIRRIAMDAITETAIETSVDATIEDEQAFRPAYPEPVHRMGADGDTTSSDRRG